MNTDWKFAKWCGFAALAAAAAMAVLLAMLQLTSWWAKLMLVMGVAVFLRVLVQYPPYWARRQIVVVISAWITLTAAGGFTLDIGIHQGMVARIVAPNLDWSFHFACVALVATFLVFELSHDISSRLPSFGTAQPRMTLRWEPLVLLFVGAVIVVVLLRHGAELARQGLAFTLILCSLLFAGIWSYRVLVDMHRSRVAPVPVVQRRLHRDIFVILKDGWQRHKTSGRLRTLAQQSEHELTSLAAAILEARYTLVPSPDDIGPHEL